MDPIVLHTIGKIRAEAYESSEFPVELRFDTEDPHVISIAFYDTHDRESPVIWAIGMSLLSDGSRTQHTPVGGDCISVAFDLELNEAVLLLRANWRDIQVILVAHEVLYFAKKVGPLATEEVMALALDAMVQRLEASLTEE